MAAKIILGLALIVAFVILGILIIQWLRERDADYRGHRIWTERREEERTDALFGPDAPDEIDRALAKQKSDDGRESASERNGRRDGGRR